MVVWDTIGGDISFRPWRASGGREIPRAACDSIASNRPLNCSGVALSEPTGEITCLEVALAGDPDDRVDLDDRAKGQRSDANGAARMAARLVEQRDHQFGGAVGDG